MKIYVWKEGMTAEESKEGAYWERNMLALWIAKMMQVTYDNAKDDGLGSKYKTIHCGWYNDTDNNWDGWHRVISLMDGAFGFHIPDDFDIGSLKEIKPNWDGHSTELKWTRMMEYCGCNMQETGGYKGVN